MQNVILIIHLLLALSLIGVVLVQRSEGGGLGVGGGGGGVMSARGAATAVGKLTWILAAGFLTTSLTLTILAARDAASTSVVDNMPAATAPAAPKAPAGAPDLTIPDTGVLVPPPADLAAPAPGAAPAKNAPATTQAPSK